MLPELDATELQRKSGCFRILIIGRANSGKTTVLRKVCDTTDQPDIYNSQGKKISVALGPSTKRGMQDINDEIVFRSKPGLIFHESRGFEAGAKDGLDTVKDFIAQRASERIFRDQLHAIWYCIPVDNHRPITVAERFFFSECGTGKVPVIVIYTKFDALDSKAFRDLKRENPDISHDSVLQIPLRALADFEQGRTHYDLFHLKFPPKDWTYLRDMDRPESGSVCLQLLEKTASALDSTALQGLFVSAHQFGLGTAYLLPCTV